MGFDKERKRIMKDAPLVTKGVNKTDNEMGNLIDNGKGVRYKDYKSFGDLL